MDSHGRVCCTNLTHLCLYLALLALFIVVCSGQTGVTVTVQAGEGFNGTRKVLTCRYAWLPPCPDITTNPDATCTLVGLTWMKGSDNIAYLSSAGNAQYPGEYNEPDYVISTMDINAGCDLTIQSVAQTDSGTYICQVDARIPHSQKESDSAELTVSIIVPPSTITLTYDGMTYSNGDSIPVVAGDGRQFTCNTPGVYPQTTFTWTLPPGITTDQSLGTQASSSNTDSTVDSSATITLTIPESPATPQLTCGATNRQDGLTDTEIDITVTLDVKVPPTVVKLLESGSELGDSLTVDQGTSHTLVCLVEGTRPAASIQWYISDAMPSTGVGDPTSSPSNELFDTSGTWSFTASRIHHKEEVKCVANTAESTGPFPEDVVIIDVNGPPNTPMITGTSSPMTEGVSTTLTCTADMGYPDDWRLVWSNANTGAPLSPASPSTTPTADQRYNFTSTLDFTPMRQDNGNTIKCAAQRDSWTQSVPEGSWGPLGVQFCARSVNMTQCPSTLTEGNTASMRCVSESSNPATTLTWSKNDDSITNPTNQPINVDGEYGGKVTEVTYTTGVLDKSNNGDVILCCGTNPSIASCPANVCDLCLLNVQYPPEFSQPTQSPANPVIEGNEVTLTCRVDANPLPNDISWQKVDSGDVPDTVVYTDDTSTLTLSDIKRKQAGYYMCRANNGIPTSDSSNDVNSSAVTVIVHYGPNITNKADNVVGTKDGENVDLTCIAMGNPEPNIIWYTPNNTVITNDTSKYTVRNGVTSGDNVFGIEVTGTLTINGVDSQRDYGQYTCNTSNGIGAEDTLKINLTGARRPNQPTDVRVTDKTADSLNMTWTAGYHGGVDQWFHVSYLKTNSEDEETFSNNITGGDNMYTVTGLEEYTDYDIRVYAENTVGRNPDYGEITERTLPKPPDELDFIIEFNPDTGTVKIQGLAGKAGCIQLEVKYTGSNVWNKCGKCIVQDTTVQLDEVCPNAQQTRRKRAVGDIEDVRTRYCIMDSCSQPATVTEVESTGSPKTENPGITGIIGIIAGVVVVLCALIIPMIALIVYRRKTSPKKSKDESTSSIELQRPDIPNNNDGISNDGIEDFAVYAKVDKRNKPTAAPITKPSGNANVTGDAGPLVTGPKPSIDGPKPVTTGPKPSIDGRKPPITGPKPSITGPKPSIDGPKPSIDGPKPSIDGRQPSITGPKPSISGPKPSIDGPKPSIDGCKPSITVPKPLAAGSKVIKQGQQAVDADEVTDTSTFADETGNSTTKLTDGSVAAAPQPKPRVKRYVVGDGDTYAEVNKPPPRPAPPTGRQNLPDVTYGVVDKGRNKKDDSVKAKKKPKKYVPPSKAAEESAYEAVNFNGETPRMPPAEDTYDNVGQQQDDSGRIVDDDGLIYLEVGHIKTHPAGKPPIQTEESTDYASLDFSRMKTDEAL